MRGVKAASTACPPESLATEVEYLSVIPSTSTGLSAECIILISGVGIAITSLIVSSATSPNPRHRDRVHSPEQQWKRRLRTMLHVVSRAHHMYIDSQALANEMS